MDSPQLTTEPTRTQDNCPAQTRGVIRQVLHAVIGLAEGIAGTISAKRALSKARRELIEATSKPIQAWPPELRAQVADQCEWSIHQMSRIIESNGYKLTHSQILRGIIDAVADADIDLSRCHSEADVKRTILEALQKNSRRFEEGGDA